MRQRLHSKIAIVTGGLSGIGEAVARRLVEEGAIVIAADLATDATALGEGPLSPLQVDVAESDERGCHGPRRRGASRPA